MEQKQIFNILTQKNMTNFTHDSLTVGVSTIAGGATSEVIQPLISDNAVQIICSMIISLVTTIIMNRKKIKETIELQKLKKQSKNDEHKENE